MKRLQIYYPEELLNDLRLYAKNHGIPLAGAIRLASREFTLKPNIKRIIDRFKKQSIKTGSNHHPIMSLSGILKGGPINMSANVDEIYNE